MEANCEEQVKKQKAQLESMVSTKMEDAVKEREKFMKENSKLQKKLIELENKHEFYMRKMRELADEVQAREEEAVENRKRWENLQGEMKSKFDEAEMEKSEALSDLAALKDKEIADLRSEVKNLQGLMKQSIGEDPPDEDWSYALTDSHDGVIDDIRETGEALIKVKKQPFFNQIKGKLVPLTVGVAAAVALAGIASNWPATLPVILAVFKKF